jgi:hypothetical protein
VIYLLLPQFSYDRATALFQRLTQVLVHHYLLSRLRENITGDPNRAIKKSKSTRDSREVSREILVDLWTLVVQPIVNVITATVSILSNLIRPRLFYLKVSHIAITQSQ